MANFENKKFVLPERDKPKLLPDKNRWRNLRQYKDLTDEEFEEVMAKKISGVDTNREFEGRIKRKIDSFGEDYDLSDLKANDHLTLRALAQAYINLEDLEQLSYNIRAGGLHDLDQVFQLEKVSSIMTKLRDDISKMQGDLNITRKLRKGDKEESVVIFIEKLKEKAKAFYQSRMCYIFCPECKELLSTVWFLNPNSEKSRVKLFCDRCNKYTVTISAKELIEKKGVNIEDVPDSYK